MTVHTFISAPREEVFDYVGDLANRVAFCDHYQHDYRLARAKSTGEGAAARFRVEPPIGSDWMDIAVVESDRPRRIREEGGLGRLGRTRVFVVYDFAPEPGGNTRVELTIWTEPAGISTRLREALGGRGWTRRQAKVALERLRRVFEERPDAPLARATVAGYEPLKAARFGA